MARKITRKSLKKDEFVDAAVDAGQWIEEHWKSVAAVAGGVVAVVLIVIGVIYWNAHRREEAQRVFGEAYELYRDPRSQDGTVTATAASRAERYPKALEQFDLAARKAGSSPLRDVATYYQGVIHLRTGDTAEAIPIFEQVAGRAASPSLVATAKAGLAQAFTEAGEPVKAETLWRELAESEAGSFFPVDVALLNLGKLLLDDSGRAGEAREVLEEIQERFPQSAASAEAGYLLDSSASR